MRNRRNRTFTPFLGLVLSFCFLSCAPSRKFPESFSLEVNHFEDFGGWTIGGGFFTSVGIPGPIKLEVESQDPGVCRSASTKPTGAVPMAPEGFPIVSVYGVGTGTCPLSFRYQLYGEPETREERSLVQVKANNPISLTVSGIENFERIGAEYLVPPLNDADGPLSCSQAVAAPALDSSSSEETSSLPAPPDVLLYCRTGWEVEPKRFVYGGGGEFVEVCVSRSNNEIQRFDYFQRNAEARTHYCLTWIGGHGKDVARCKHLHACSELESLRDRIGPR